MKTRLLDSTGQEVRVKQVRTVTLYKRSYNLTVRGFHTYHVGRGIWVHNCSDSLDDLAAAGQSPAKGGRTAAGRSYQKHQDREKDGLPKVSGKDLDQAGQDLLEDILTDPKSVRSSTPEGGVRIVRPDVEVLCFARTVALNTLVTECIRKMNYET